MWFGVGWLVVDLFFDIGLLCLTLVVLELSIPGCLKLRDLSGSAGTKDAHTTIF